MDGLFGIDIARKAMQAMQYGMDVTAHNIANANTDGYSRQRVILGTTEPFPAPSFNRPMITAQFGTGVEVKSVARVRESYFDGQTRKENQALGGWEVTDNTLKQLETVFNEPSDSGIQTMMGEFYNSWQQLSKNPESVSARNSVLQTGQMLVTAFNQIDKQLTRLQENVNEQIKVKVDDINDIAKRLSSLNRDILKSTTFGTEPNDLLDQRDQLIDQLSKYADITVVELDSGLSKIAINGVFLVDEFSAYEIQAVPDPGNSGYYDVKWTLDGSQVTMLGGSVKALVDSRDTLVPKYRTDFDNLANSLIAEVNDLHRAGFALDGSTNWNFFSGTGADGIALSADVSDPTHIAASLGGAPGDNSNALKIAQLKNGLVMNGDTVSMDDYYRSFVTNLGVESQSSGRMVTNGKQYLELIDTHRQSISGVSLDEEATNMIKFQRGYEAAARVITIMNEMLEELINIGR